jgi:hypothetical protein
VLKPSSRGEGFEPLREGCADGGEFSQISVNILARNVKFRRANIGTVAQKVVTTIAMNQKEPL